MWEMILWPFSNVWSALLMGAGAVLVSAIAGAVVGVFPVKRRTSDIKLVGDAGVRKGRA